MVSIHPRPERCLHQGGAAVVFWRLVGGREVSASEWDSKFRCVAKKGCWFADGGLPGDTVSIGEN